MDKDTLSNIFGKPEDYRIHFDGVRYIVFNPIAVEGNFDSEYKANSWIARRCTIRIVPARIYADICRCGCLKKDWDYYDTDGLKFERCNLCNNPIRHNAMLAINRDLLEDFDLDEFLGL